MSFLSDAKEWVSDRVDDVKEVAGDVVSKVPGSEWLGEQLTDFLKTDAGLLVARALSTSLYGGLAPVLGPQLAAAAFATPGIIRGDRFDKAWLEEFQWRVEQLAQILGDDAAKGLSSMLGPTIEKLKADLPSLRDLGAVPSAMIPHMPGVEEILRKAPWEIALPRDLREDLTAVALSALTRVPIDLSPYDVATGKDVRVSDQQRVKLLYPYASMYVADKMHSHVSMFAQESTVADKMRSKVSLFAAGEPAPTAPLPATPASPTLPTFQPPPLVKAPNPLLRESSDMPLDQAAKAWGPWLKILGLGALAGGAAFVWSRR